jgi:hypothetical protein
MRYRMNTPAVASQVIAGEAILIHFDSGRYYTVEGSGADILTWLEEGRSIGEIVSAWDASVGAGRGAIEKAVDGFVRTLLDEGLLSAMEDAKDADAPTAGPQATQLATKNGPVATAAFVAPALVTYTDLEDLLRLDPIHDVDDAGWPIPKVV